MSNATSDLPSNSFRSPRWDSAIAPGEFLEAFDRVVELWLAVFGRIGIGLCRELDGIGGVELRLQEFESILIAERGRAGIFFGIDFLAPHRFQFAPQVTDNAVERLGGCQIGLAGLPLFGFDGFAGQQLCRPNHLQLAQLQPRLALTRVAFAFEKLLERGFGIGKRLVPVVGVAGMERRFDVRLRFLQRNRGDERRIDSRHLCRSIQIADRGIKVTGVAKLLDEGFGRFTLGTDVLR